MSAPTGPEPEVRAESLVIPLYGGDIMGTLREAGWMHPRLAEQLRAQVAALQADVARLEGERDEARAETQRIWEEMTVIQLRLEGERDAARRLADEGCGLLARGQEIIATLTAEQDAMRPVVEAAAMRAQVLLDLRAFGSGSDGWDQRDRDSDRAILAAVDQMGAQTRVVAATPLVGADEAASPQPERLDLDTNPDGTHRYVSTGCVHGKHHECATQGKRWDGTDKIPATCKWCGAPCQCTECDHTPPAPIGVHPVNELPDGTAFVGTAEEAAAASTTPTGDQT